LDSFILIFYIIILFKVVNKCNVINKLCIIKNDKWTNIIFIYTRKLIRSLSILWSCTPFKKKKHQFSPTSFRDTTIFYGWIDLKTRDQFLTLEVGGRSGFPHLAPTSPSFACPSARSNATLHFQTRFSVHWRTSPTSHDNGFVGNLMTINLSPKKMLYEHFSACSSRFPKRPFFGFFRFMQKVINIFLWNFNCRKTPPKGTI